MKWFIDLISSPFGFIGLIVVVGLLFYVINLIYERFFNWW